MSSQTETMRVFVAGSSHDRDLITFLAEQLKSAGMEVRTSVTATASDEAIQKSLFQTIRDCHASIFLLTPQSIHSPNMMVEAGAAIASGQPVISVIAGVESGQVPAPFRETSTYRFHDFDSAIHKLELALPAMK